MIEEIKKEYSNGELTIVWKPQTCIHSGECVKRLPKVYDPKAKPWITIENATNKELMEQIEACPSGALTYYLTDDESIVKSETSKGTKVEVLPNGPLVVEGKLLVIYADGDTETKDKKTAFCRCGASNKKPFCDGSHNKINFSG